MDSQLTLLTNCQIHSQNAGLFVSRGRGRHPTRVLDSYELILVKQGQLDIWEAEQTFSLTAGQTLLLSPLQQHGGLGALPSDLAFYWIHFEADATLRHDDRLAGQRLPIPQVNTLSRPEKLEALFRYFLDSQEAGDLRQEAANCLVTLMLLEVGLAARPAQADADKLSALAEMVRNFIWVHVGETTSAGDVARELGYNPDYLGRVYRGVYGRTITHTIHESRVARACQLLIDSDILIEDIALECGFSNADYFRRIFKRHKLITPFAFRKINSRLYVNTH